MKQLKSGWVQGRRIRIGQEVKVKALNGEHIEGVVTRIVEGRDHGYAVVVTESGPRLCEVERRWVMST